MSTSSATQSGLDKNKKKMLGVSAAALLLGGSAWAITQKLKGDEPGSPHEMIGSEDQTDAIALPPDIDVAGKVTDTMSFEQAFKTAREEVGVGGVFGWHGHWYNTFEAEEWNSLSLEQRQEFTEMVTQEQLPIKPYSTVESNPHASVQSDHTTQDPTIIEGHLNGQRVMGLDFDRDGIVDTLVLDAEDGYTYRVVDATGDEGLDTLFRYDALNGELVEIEKIHEPFVLSNDQFSQALEESVPRDIVDSILAPDSSVHVSATHELPETNIDHDEDDSTSDLNELDDTYINDGDVRDMDE